MTSVLPLMVAYGGTGAPPPVAFTWNPLDTGTNITFSNSNRTVTKSTGAASRSVRSTVAMPDGGYVEILVGTGNTSPFMMVGLANASAPLSGSLGVDTNSWSYYQQTGQKFTNNVGTAYGASYAQGDILGIAYKNGKVYFSKNNVWQGSGDPVAETGEAYSGLAGTLFVACSLYRASPDSSVMTISAEASQQTYSPPSGYFAPG